MVIISTIMTAKVRELATVVRALFVLISYVPTATPCSNYHVVDRRVH